MSFIFYFFFFFFFSSRRRHTRSLCDWSSDVCSSDLAPSRAARPAVALGQPEPHPPLDDLAEKREAQHDRHRGDPDRAKPGERAVAEDTADHHPQARQAQWDEDQPGDAAQRE